MNRARTLLAEMAERVDLPPDLAAGLPSIEVAGFREMSMEPHDGLVEYTRERVSVESCIGRVTVLGTGLTIKRMNRERITVAGNLTGVELQGGGHG